MDVPPGGFEATVVRPPDRPTSPMAPRQTPMSTPRVILPPTDELDHAEAALGPIGRRKPPRTPAAQMEDVLAEVFERVQGVYQRRDAADGLGYLLDPPWRRSRPRRGACSRASWSRAICSSW